MDKDIRNKWTRALKRKISPYRQGKALLHRHPPVGPDLYCPLGVLCEVAVKAGVAVREEPNKFGEIRYSCPSNRDDTSKAFPPKAVMEWSGLDERNMRFIARMNDRDGMSFQDIAEWIKSNL